MPPERVKVAIVGSRDFPYPALVDRVVYLLPRDIVIVSGGASGVDSWAEATAKHWRKDTLIFKPDWAKHGRVAGFIRNNEIVRNCDIVIAFLHKSSKGTKHTISLAKYLGKPCYVVRTK